MKTKTVGMIFVIVLIGAVLIGISTAVARDINDPDSATMSKIIANREMGLSGQEGVKPCIADVVLHFAEVPSRNFEEIKCYGNNNDVITTKTGVGAVSNYDSSQPIDQGDAQWQQIVMPMNLNGAWKAEVIANHDWSNSAWTIADAFEEAQANQVPHYIYSTELFPVEIAIYISEQFANSFWG